MEENNSEIINKSDQQRNQFYGWKAMCEALLKCINEYKKTKTRSNAESFSLYLIRNFRPLDCPITVQFHRN